MQSSVVDSDPNYSVSPRSVSQRGVGFALCLSAQSGIRAVLVSLESDSALC